MDKNSFDFDKTFNELYLLAKTKFKDVRHVFNNVKNDHIIQEQPFTSYYLANELIEILQID